MELETRQGFWWPTQRCEVAVGTLDRESGIKETQPGPGWLVRLPRGRSHFLPLPGAPAESCGVCRGVRFTGSWLPEASSTPSSRPPGSI